MKENKIIRKKVNQYTAYLFIYLFIVFADGESPQTPTNHSVMVVVGLNGTLQAMLNIVFAKISICQNLHYFFCLFLSFKTVKTSKF